MEEIQESLTKAEKEEFRVTKKQRDTEEECRTSLKQEYKQKKEALKVLSGKRSAQAKKRTSKKDTPEDILARHKVLNMVPKGALTQQECARMCPLEAQSGMDGTQGAGTFTCHHMSGSVPAGQFMATSREPSGGSGPCGSGGWRTTTWMRRHAL